MITFLNYPQFEEYAYPSLHECFTVDLSKLSLRKANYSASENPPILHRKETFVLPNHPNFELYCAITKEGEDAGLYENTRTIGFRKNWDRIIRAKGLKLSATGRLELLASSGSEESNLVSVRAEHVVEVHRHKTAIVRDKLSQPMQILARHEYLSGEYSILDYGCGKGDDLRELEAHGIDATGWDPMHHPEGQLLVSDIVNLGFVLNVIEDYEERNATLIDAWGYSKKALIVSSMIAGESVISQFTQYKDGVLTSRKTFQKYYSQSEFRSYIERVLDEPAIAVGQGIFSSSKTKSRNSPSFSKDNISKETGYKNLREYVLHICRLLALAIWKSTTPYSITFGKLAWN